MFLNIIFWGQWTHKSLVCGLRLWFNGYNFGLKVNSFKSFSNGFLFCLILLVSQLLKLFFFLAGIVQLIWWSGPEVLGFSFHPVDCISGLSLCFLKLRYLLITFFILHNSRFSQFWLTSLTVSAEWNLNSFTHWIALSSEYGQCQKVQNQNKLHKPIMIRLSKFIRAIASWH